MQVIKEPGGSKGPRLTSHITLPGRLAVLLPTVGYVGVSRRIEAEDERSRLRAMAESLKPEGMGLIVRTAAEGVIEADLERDVRYLKRAVGFHFPALGFDHRAGAFARDASLVYRAVRDMLVNGVKSLTIDDPRPVRAGQVHRRDALAGARGKGRPSCRGNADLRALSHRRAGRKGAASARLAEERRLSGV